MPVAILYGALMALLRWMAVLASAVLLANFYRDGVLLGKSLAIHLSWFAAAAWLQFFASSAALSAIGLLLQTVLAVYLILRWKMS